MQCQCKTKEFKYNSKICANCGRFIPDPPLVSTGMFAREAIKLMQHQLVLAARFPGQPLPKLTTRQKIARRIKESRRRLRNVEAAISGAWEADKDY